MRKILAVVMLAAMLVPGAALADGDPASDVLLGENVFYPYQPPVSNALQAQLNAAAGAAKIKVALIASPVDLGVIPDLFNKPQQYAKFLDQEISFQNSKVPLLVVMPAGYGVSGLSAKATQAATSLPRPAGAKSDDLARAAIAALPKLSGHPLHVGQPATTHHSGSSRTLLLVVLIVAAVVIAGALIALRRRAVTARR